jgi:hypothetical protein
MYKLKNMAKRSTAFAGAVSLLAGIGTSALPAFVSADALNPLTERSLTLSSSSPGWSYLDGSGNTTYAPPHSGANGQKTGETYTFRVSSTSTAVKAMTFQFCTTPAGTCFAPGNNGFTGSSPTATRNSDTTSTTDLNVVTSSPSEVTSGDWTSIAASDDKTPNPDGTEGNFVVLHGATSSVTYSGASASWDMAASNQETGDALHATGTGANNLITVTSSTGQATTAGDYFKIIFFGTDDNYITNPGMGAFFVRINTYSDDSLIDDAHLIDGGVTVANVMNESISIQTKVLETMDFSVGTHDPDQYTRSRLVTTLGLPALGQCNTLLMADPNGSGVTDNSTYSAQPHNVLKLGDSNAEYSLKTDTAYDVQSFWRLSSNSSGGATVYYTGHTLTNTVGDEIAPLSDSVSGGTASSTGTEQFGLAINHGTSSLPIGPGGSSVESYPVALTGGETYGDSDADGGSGDGDFASFLFDNSGKGDAYAHAPRLYPLIPTDPYDDGNGTITSGGTAKFAFNAHADSYAIPIASESTQVVNCVTAKMRYIANIAATTPAGIYTTKVNYVASPQY